MKEFFGGKVRIKEIKPIIDGQGRTYEWCKNEPGWQVTFYEEPTDYISNHYHLGEDPSKNPEKFLLVRGSIEIEFYDMRLHKSLKRTINTATDGKTEIKIYPMIRHKVTALTNITFAEYRATPFDKEKPDTYTIEELVDE